MAKDTGKGSRKGAVKSRTQVKKPATFDEYLSNLTGEQRLALEKLRQAIRRAAPKAEECIAYGLPSFRLNGSVLVSLGAAAKHCSFYLGSTMQRHRDELKGYDTNSQGTIRFPADKPLPAALVTRLVKARVAENKRFQA